MTRQRDLTNDVVVIYDEGVSLGRLRRPMNLPRRRPSWSLAGFSAPCGHELKLQRSERLRSVRPQGVTPRPLQRTSVAQPDEARAATKGQDGRARHRPNSLRQCRIGESMKPRRVWQHSRGVAHSDEE